MYVPTIKDKSRLLFRLSHLFIWSIIGILVGTREPFQDAAYSNIIAPRSFYTNGHFELFSFKDNMRGYFLPFISICLRNIFDILHINFNIGMLLMNIVIFTTLSSILLPKLVKIIFENTNEIYISIPILIFMIIFYRGYISYMSTDFISTFLSLIAIILVLQKFTYLRLIAIGFLVSAAINIRVAFIFTLFVIIALLIWQQFKIWRSEKLGKSYLIKKLTITMLLFVIGFSTVSFSQVIINRNLEKSYSPFPLSRLSIPDNWASDNYVIPIKNSDLSIFQLSVGLGIQRFEGIHKLEGNPALFFHDKEGEKIIEKYLPISSLKEYISIWKNEPVSMTKINSRHILNGFDPNFSGPFLEKSQKIPTVFKLLTLLLLFINMILRKKPLLASKYLLIISIFTLSGFISTIPAAIEPRFFILPTLVLFSVFIGIVTTHWKVLVNKKYQIIPIALFSIVFSIFYYKYNLHVLTTLGPLNNDFLN